MSLNYSKWDNIDSDTDSEDEGKKANASGIEKAWSEIDKLQNYADQVYHAAEGMNQSGGAAGADKDKNLNTYKSALTHYEEVLRLVQKALMLQPGDAARGNKVIVACQLNSACCYIRASIWSEAKQVCGQVLTMNNLEKVDELKALYFRMHAALKLATDGLNEMKAYEDQGVEVPRSKGCDLQCKLMAEDHSKMTDLLKCHPALQSEDYTKHLNDISSFLSEYKERYGASAFSPDYNTHAAAPSSSSGSGNGNKQVQVVEEEEDEIEEIQSVGVKKLEAVNPSPKQSLKPSKGKSSSKPTQGPSPAEQDKDNKVSGIRHLQMGSSHYKTKAFKEAQESYRAAMNCFDKHLKQQGNNNSEDGVMAAISKAGYGAATVALKDPKGYEEAAALLVEAMNFLQYHVEVEMKAQNDPTGKMSTSQKSQAARQTLMKIQHLWNTYDNLSDCYVYLQEWQNALLVVDNTLKVCQLVLSWERRLNEDPDDKTSSSSSSSSSSGRSPEGPTSTAGAPGKKQSPPVVDAQVRAAVQGIRKRRAGTLVSKGHLLQSIAEGKKSHDDASSAGTEKELSSEGVHLRRTRKDGAVVVDSGTDVESIVHYWELAAKEFSDIDLPQDAHLTYSYMASLMGKAAGGLPAFMDQIDLSAEAGGEKRTPALAEKLAAEMGLGDKKAAENKLLEEKNRREAEVAKNGEAINVDLAESSHNYWRQAAMEAQRVAETSKKLRTMNSSSPGTGGKIPNASIISKCLNSERSALNKAMLSLYEAGVAALHCSAACPSTDSSSAANADASYIALAQRAFEAALLAKDEYLAVSSPLEETIPGGKDGAQWKDYHLVVGDVFYHAGQAYLRAGKLTYALKEVQRAVDFYITGGDRRRQRMALGVQALVHSMQCSEIAGGAASEITAAALLVEEDIQQVKGACLAPADDAELEERRVRAYIQRRSPKTASGPPTAAAGLVDPKTRNKKDAASALPSTDNEKEKPAIKMMTAARAQELKEQSQAEHALRRQQQEKEREEKQKEKEEKEENNAAGWGGQVQTAVMENRIVVFFMGDSTWSLVAAWGVVLAALIAVLIGTYSLVLENKE